MKVERLFMMVASLMMLSSLMLFQNCSSGLPDAASNFNTSNGTPSCNKTFQKGETFDYARVANASQMVGSQLAALGYQASSLPRAVAVAASGLGFVSVPVDGTQDDANLTALQGCFSITGGQPCALLAVADKFNFSSQELGSNYKFSFAAPSTLNAASVPYVTAAKASVLASGYAALTQANKAVAISLDGVVAVVASTTAETVASPAEALRMALERCEMAALITPCTPFMQGSSITFNPAVINRSAQIDYSKTAPSGWFPGHSNSHGLSQITNRWDKRGSSHGAVYLSPGGNFGGDLDLNLNVARTTALNQCQTGVDPAYPCVLYADTGYNPVVFFNGTSLTAYKYSTEMHCRSVPRFNCAQHKSMGCPAGKAYTTYQGSITLEDCL